MGLLGVFNDGVVVRYWRQPGKKDCLGGEWERDIGGREDESWRKLQHPKNDGSIKQPIFLLHFASYLNYINSYPIKYQKIIISCFPLTPITKTANKTGSSWDSSIHSRISLSATPQSYPDGRWSSAILRKTIELSLKYTIHSQLYSLPLKSQNSDSSRLNWELTSSTSSEENYGSI